MPYARTNWTIRELKLALANPVHADGGPHAHSNIHAVASELANHPLFQKARVTAQIVGGNARYSNAKYHAKGPDGTWVKKPDGTNLYSNNQRKQNPMPSPDADKHSALNVEDVAAALATALSDPALQPHLAVIDAGNDMKVHLNFAAHIGRGNLHQTGMASQTVDFISLFVYAKRNPNNKDVPIFQTVVPSNQHKVGGSDPIIAL